MFETWSIWEVIWSLVAAVGAGYSALNIRDGIYDLAILDIANGEEERITAGGNVRRDSYRLIIQVDSLLIGIWAGLLSNPVNHGRELEAFLFSLVFIVNSGLLTLSAFRDHSDRLKLVALKLAKIKETISEIREHLKIE